MAVNGPVGSKMAQEDHIIDQRHHKEDQSIVLKYHIYQPQEVGKI